MRPRRAIQLGVAIGVLAAGFAPASRAVAAAHANASVSISSVAVGGTLPDAPVVTVSGSGFGAVSPTPDAAAVPCAVAGAGSYYGQSLNVKSLTGRWSAGKNTPTALRSDNGLLIDSWSDTQVRFHFDGCWTAHHDRIQPGDALTLVVRGASFNSVVPDPGAGNHAGIVAPGPLFRPHFPTEPAGGWSSTSVDVKVTRAPLSDPNAFYYYADQWEMNTPATELGVTTAYMGIQTQGFNGGVNVGPMALVSIFTSVPLAIVPGTGTDGQPAWCFTNGDIGEGAISTCRVRFAWQQGHAYRYRFARTAAQQWTATITDLSASGAPVTTLGTFTVPASWQGIHKVAAGFLEQYSGPPETKPSAAHPVCPSTGHRTTAQFVNARLGATDAPTAQGPEIDPLNNGSTAIRCQNTTASLVPSGVQLDTDLPTPAPVTAPHAATTGTAVTVGWTAPRDPMTVTRGELSAAMFSTSVVQQLAAIARPMPTSYTVTLSPGGRHTNVPASQHTATFSGLQRGQTYQLSITSDNDGSHSAPVSASVRVPAAPAPVAQVHHGASGYRMVDARGTVYPFGTAHNVGNATTTGVVHVEATRSGSGYWIVNQAGRVFGFGNAAHLGDATGLAPGEYVTTMSATPSGHGYWLFTNRGRVERFGDARFFGDLSAVQLNGSIVGSVATPTGHGYYLVGSDGGVFTFGDARFRGSMGATRLNQPVVGLVPTADNRGYWLVAADGGIFSFGTARFRGSTGSLTLNRPIIGMVRYGNGYLMVASDGGIFVFSNRPFLGSLGGHDVAAPIVGVATS